SGRESSGRAGRRGASWRARVRLAPRSALRQFRQPLCCLDERLLAVLRAAAHVRALYRGQCEARERPGAPGVAEVEVRGDAVDPLVEGISQYGLQAGGVAVEVE